MCVFVLLIYVCVFMVSLPLAQLLQNQKPTAPHRSAKIPHPFHLTVPAVDRTNSPLSPRLPSSSVHYQIVHHNRPDPSPGPPLFLLLPSSSNVLLNYHHRFHFVPPLQWSCRSPPSFTPLTFFSPSPLPSPLTSAPLPHLLFSPFFFSNPFFPPLPSSVPGELTTQGEQKHTANINGLGWILINCAS